jgi:hypothetical protein
MPSELPELLVQHPNIPRDYLIARRVNRNAFPLDCKVSAWLVLCEWPNTVNLAELFVSNSRRLALD